MDIEPQQTCIDITKVHAYCRERRKKLKLRRSRFALRFGNDLHTSLGHMRIRIPTPDESFVHTIPEVVSVEEPFLLGIGVLDQEGWVADNMRNRVECREKG